MQAIASLDAWQELRTFGGGRYAKIEKVAYCPAAGCSQTPYIRTVADGFAPDNLDNLPPC